MGVTTNKPLNLQDSFLNKVRSEKKTIVIYLLNGFQVRGRVWGFDNFTVIIEADGRQELIYKHAISTTAPVDAGSILVLKKGNDQSVSKE